MSLRVLCALFTLLPSFGILLGQQIVNHNVDFNSGVQNMWGPSFNPFTIDQEITLFEQGWDVSFDTGSSGITTIGGQSFGGALSGGFSGVIGSEIRIEGFTTGTVEVDYPVNIELDMPTDLSYDQGDNVIISSSYNCLNGWDLETLYPTAGEFFWDLYFQMAASASAQLCFFGCVTFPIIPSFDTGLQTLNILTISGSGASTNGVTGVWCLGPGAIPDAFPVPAIEDQEPPAGNWPFALAPEEDPSTSPFPNFIPWQVYYGSYFPIDLPSALGLSGSVTIPYVSTEPTINSSGDINACGDSTYFNMNLEIFDLLGGILSNVPGPVGAVGQFLVNLSGSQEIGGIATVNWNFFSASFDANITNKQCFDFIPKIYAELEFPLPVNYSIIDALSGSVSSSGQSSIITFEVGDQLQYQYPCYYEELSITPTYSIDGEFTNHTFDEVSFDFLMSAFEFGFEIPEVVVIPGFTIPEICIPIPYPCPTWSCPWCWCTYTACTPEVVVPDLGFPGFSLSVGPVWSTSIPLGSFSYDWFLDTWSLEGFTPFTKPPFKMMASPIQVSSNVNDVACFEDATGSIDVTINAQSHAYPYSFIWSNGSSFTNNSPTTSLTNMPSGQYTVDIFDNNGCQLFTGGTINQPAELYLSYVKIDKQCGAGTNDGSIDLSVYGGTSPYTFDWSNGATSEDLSNLNSGTYSVIVTDFRGCTENLEIIIIEPNPLVNNGLISHVNCKGGSDGAIDISTFGGNLPYSFSWDTGQNTQDLSTLAANTYTLTVTDSKGCLIQSSFDVNEPLEFLSLSASPSSISCYGENTGNIDVTTSGGTPGYNYVWVSPINGVLPYFSEDLNNISAGEYILNATDENGCTSNISIEVLQPTYPISINPDISDVLCKGESNGFINPNVFGGTPSYTFDWSNGASSQQISALDIGNYTIDVTDSEGCLQSFTFSIAEPETALSATFIQTDVTCFGGNTGSISISASGGTGAYSYQWSNGYSLAYSNELAAGIYNILVTDENLCSYTEDISIEQPSNSLNSIASIQHVDCFENETGSIDVSISGGTPPYSYTWISSDSIVMTNTSQLLSGLSANSYALQVHDSLNCVQFYSYDVLQPTEPVSIDFNTMDASCFSLSDGQISLIVSGGTGSYTYLWNTGQVSSNINSIPAGIYQCDVYDENNCLTSIDIDVYEPESALIASTESKDVLCNGDDSGEIIATIEGGTPPYSFVWSSGQISQSIYNLYPGNYSLTVTDSKGCNAFSGGVIDEPDPLEVSNSVQDVLCFGDSNGSIAITVSGGVQPYYFNWGNQNNILLNNPSEILEGYPAGLYLIRVIDENSCINEQTLYIQEPEIFESSFEWTNVLCYAETNGTVSVFLQGGTSPYSIQWNNGETSNEITNLAPGTYQYFAFDDHNCKTENTLVISQPDPIEIETEINPVSCVDQSNGEISVSIYGGTSPYEIMWSNGSSATILNNLSGGNYILTVSDEHGCLTEAEIVVETVAESCIDIPNTFTPNGDLYNDTWIITNIDLYPGYELHVFNKWGNEVYNNTSNNQDKWDGTHYGNPLPSDVYYYILKLNNADDIQYSGTITLLR